MPLPSLTQIVADPKRAFKGLLPQPVLIGDLQIDVLQYLSYGRSYQATEIELEEGALVIDHIRKGPLTVHVEGIFSDSTLHPFGMLSRVFIGGWQLSTWQEKRDAFIDLCEGGNLLEFSSANEMFDNMVVTSRDISISNSKDFTLCRFTLDMMQYDFASTEVSLVDPSQLPVKPEPQSAKKKGPNAGEKAAAKKAAEGQKGSVLWNAKESIVKGIGGLFG